MQVILLERIRNLGDLGDEVTVRGGYGRNYLIPQGRAVRATGEEREAFEARRAELEKRAREQLQEAEERARALDGTRVTIAARAGEEGRLYGSVSPRDIVDALAAEGFRVERHEVQMPHGPIREVGEYEVELHLHTDVVATIEVAVIPA